MNQIGYQPRHIIDKPDDYREFLLHKSIMNQYLTHRLFISPNTSQSISGDPLKKPKKKSILKVKDEF